MKAKSNTKTLAQLIDEQYGKKGTPKRDKFDKGYETFKLGGNDTRSQIRERFDTGTTCRKVWYE